MTDDTESMMGFRKFPKIKRIGDVSIKDMLFKKIDFMTEKMDGFNTSIWKMDGQAHAGKRNSEISLDAKKQFTQFTTWIKESNWDFLPEYTILYGEGLRGNESTPGVYKSAGKINYPEKVPFIMFSIYHKDKWIKPNSKFWKDIVSGYKKCNKGKILPCVPILAKNIKLAYTDLTQYLGDSEYCSGVNKEGIVLSSYDKEGNVTMGKFVDELFEEVKRKKQPKGSNYDELLISVVTKPRVEKLMRTHEITDMKKFGKLIGLVSEDVFEEEKEHLKEQAWKLFKKDFGRRIPKVLMKLFYEIREEQNKFGKRVRTL